MFWFARSSFRLTSVSNGVKSAKDGEFCSCGNMVPQQSLRSMFGISLAVWIMTLSYCVHCIPKYKNTSYIFTSFFWQ